MCSQITVIAGIPVYTRSLYVSVLDEEVAMMLTWRTALAVAPYAGVCVCVANTSHVTGPDSYNSLSHIHSDKCMADNIISSDV